MLVNKDLIAKKEINSIEAEWSRAHKDITKVKIAVSDELADALAREQAKNKLLAQCMENGKKFKYFALVASQDNVKIMFAKIKMLGKKDQLSLLRTEIKFEREGFFELPCDFLFRQMISLLTKCLKTSWLYMQWNQPTKISSPLKTSMR